MTIYHARTSHLFWNSRLNQVFFLLFESRKSTYIYKYTTTRYKTRAFIKFPILLIVPNFIYGYVLHHNPSIIVYLLDGIFSSV